MLEKLRAKPDHIKQGISFAITLVIFSGILFVWVSSRDARSREMEVREKTVAPLNSVTSMFSGFASEIKQKISNTTPSVEQATSTEADDFDISGVVIIDQTVSTTTKR